MGSRSGALSIDDVDLDDLVVARNDVHPETSWWFDPASGRCLYLGPEDFTDRVAVRDTEGLRLIDEAPQPAADGDDFLTGLAAGHPDDGESAEIARLHRLLHGRRGWRKFRDAVATGRFATAWQHFAVERERERARGWLLANDLVRGTIDDDG